MRKSEHVCRSRASSGLVLLVTVASLAILPARESSGQGDGLLTKDTRRLFPIGSYELPADDAALKVMAESGVNLVRCHNRADLDRADAVGMMGWIPLSVHSGATDELRKLVESVKDHPALAIWEGPDEIVWNFTAASQLHRARDIHKSPGEWWRQTPQAVAYAEQQAQKIMPTIREGIQFVRSLDGRNRQFWFNEALKSDVKYVRQYLDYVDITGCDIYPVKKHDRRVARVGSATERWKQVGRGKPVWMVLQAFAWSELGDYYGEKIAAYHCGLSDVCGVAIHGLRRHRPRCQGSPVLGITLPEIRGFSGIALCPDQRVGGTATIPGRAGRNARAPGGD